MQSKLQGQEFLYSPPLPLPFVLVLDPDAVDPLIFITKGAVFGGNISASDNGGDDQVCTAVVFIFDQRLNNPGELRIDPINLLISHRSSAPPGRNKGSSSAITTSPTRRTV